MSKNKKQAKKEEIEIKEEKKEIKDDKVELTALKNTYLADGTFVRKGDKVKVTKEYAERVKKEKANNFK